MDPTPGRAAAPSPEETPNTLPRPEIDILSTSHIRTFLAGSGGPHMDVLLYNQITLSRQIQDIRVVLDQILQNQKKGISTRPESKEVAEADLGQEEEDDIEEASKRFLEMGGEMKKTRSKNVTIAVKKWFAALTDDEALSTTAKEALISLTEPQQETLHVNIASRIIPQKKSTSKGKGKGKARATTVTGGEPVEEDDSDESIVLPGSKRTRRRVSQT